MGLERGVAYLITKAEAGGAQSHVLELMTGYRGLFPLYLIVGQEGLLTERARDLGVSVHVVPSLEHAVRPLHDARALRELVQLIRRLTPTILHAHTSKAGLLGRLAAALCGVRAVYTLHNWVADPGYPLVQRLSSAGGERLLRVLTPQVITVSAAIRARALKARIISAARIVTIPLGVADTEFRAKPETSGVVRVIMVARFAPPKDHASLIRAVSGMNPRVELWLVGDGPQLDACRAQAHAAGIASCCRFVGNSANVPELLAQCHICALSSRSENLPLTVVEAMRAGLPVVATDVGGTNELVLHGKTGYLCCAGDQRSLREHLETLVQSNEHRGALGGAGRARYVAHFHASRMLESTLALYGKVEAESRPPYW